MDYFSESNIQRFDRLKSPRRIYLLNLIPLGCVFLFSLFFSFWPSLGAFAIYVWALFAAFASIYLLFYFLPKMTAKAYPPRSFRFKWMTNLYLSWAIPEKREASIRKGIALATAAIFFVRFYFNGSGDALETISNLQCDYMNPFEVAMSSIFNCLWIGTVIFSTVVEFYPTNIFIRIRKFVLTPVLILSLFFFPFIVEGVVGKVDVSLFQYRALLMGIELGLLLAFSLSDWRKDSSLVCTKKERYGIVVGVLILIICNMSAYLWQNLFGPYSRILPLALDLNVSHRLLIYLCFLLPVFYFFLLYPFDAVHRRAFLVCVSYGVFFGYISVNRVSIWSSVTTWPLHICNTAMYTMKTAIIGASSAGLYLAIFLKKNHPEYEVVVFDKNEKIGKKIYATGNGRCNLLNTATSPKDYNHPSYMEPLLKTYDYPRLKAELNGLGIEVVSEGVNVYPASLQASSFVKYLTDLALKLGVEFRLSTKIVGYHHAKNWILETDQGASSFDKIVFATGGKSQPKLGSDGSLFPVFSAHGYRLVPLKPSLCPIVTLEKTKSLSGLRHVLR